MSKYYLIIKEKQHQKCTNICLRMCLCKCRCVWVYVDTTKKRKTGQYASQMSSDSWALYERQKPKQSRKNFGKIENKIKNFLFLFTIKEKKTTRPQECIYVHIYMHR